MTMLIKLRNWLKTQGYTGIILSRRDNYTWLTDGAKNHVLSSTEYGVAYLIVTETNLLLMADCSDLVRMSKEQNPLDAEAIEIPWYQSAEEALRQIMMREAQGIWVSDTGIAETLNVQNELVELRLPLTERQLEQYREVGKLCANLVERVCQEVEIGQTELEVANALKIACIKHGVSPDCVLVGADERILNYRHPMPTDKKIQKSVMVVLGGEKYGLNVSLTRMVYYDDIPVEIAEKYRRVQYIFACMQRLMKKDLCYQEYFRKVQELYEEAGWPEEWKCHHQGGPTGYGCREYVVTPEENRKIKENQAYAWNPTICGTKCEETTYFDGEQIEILTATAGWPRKEIETPYGKLSVAEIKQIKFSFLK